MANINLAGLDINRLRPLAIKLFGDDSNENIQQTVIRISVARCARVSYINYEGKDDYEADIKLYDRLVASGSDGAFHASPFEHCARTMSREEYENYIKGYFSREKADLISADYYGWCRNFKGFIQLRALIEK